MLSDNKVEYNSVVYKVYDIKDYLLILTCKL